MSWKGGNGHDSDLENEQRHGHGRRHDDHPDWKAVAPRWLLVILAGAFVAMVAATAYSQVELLAATRTELAAVVQRTTNLERGADDTALEVAATREDMLSFQLYTAKRMQADEQFLADLSARHERAKARVDELERERVQRGRPRILGR